MIIPEECFHCTNYLACDICGLFEEKSEAELLFSADHDLDGPAKHWTFLDFIKESLPSFLYRFRDYLIRLIKS